MRKTIVRGAFMAAAATVVFGLSAGTASATPAMTHPTTGVTCPAQLPQNPTSPDWYNAWNVSGACLGGGAAGLISAAWGGFLPEFAGGIFYPR
jgi:hypothetical protein